MFLDLSLLFRLTHREDGNDVAKRRRRNFLPRVAALVS